MQNTPKNVKNTNADWHCLDKEKECKICVSDSFFSLVSHYVHAHPNREVFSSRVTPDVANFLRTSNKRHKYEIIWAPPAHRHKQICYFCNELKCYRKSNWIEHIITHTGDYKYKCTGCLKKFRKNCKHLCENNGSVVRVPQSYFNDVNVMAYLCDLCNYVRFDKEDIERHLRNEHETDVNEQYKEVTFLRFSNFKDSDQFAQPLMKRKDTAGASNGKMDSFLFILFLPHSIVAHNLITFPM